MSSREKRHLRVNAVEDPGAKAAKERRSADLGMFRDRRYEVMYSRVLDSRLVLERPSLASQASLSCRH
jgi:hypothetical protein